MSDLEENKINEEASNSKETNKDAATPEVLESEKTLEVTETSEYNERNKGITRAVKASTAIAATAVVAIVSYSVISSSGLINLTMDAKINSVEFVDDGLDYDINVIDVKNFDQMLDVEEELRIPIMFYETKKGTEGELVIVTNEIAYRYILKDKKK